MNARRPRLLDLFCCAGGASVGYHRAGFDVVGVDIKPQPRYPFRFIQADAMTFPLDGYDAIHASPPCQRYARITAVHGRQAEHPDLLDATRVRLQESGLPWVIENVPDAPLVGIVLCGSMFGLGSAGELDGVYRQLRRHRRFETSLDLCILTPRCSHDGEPIGVYGHGGPQRKTTHAGGANRGYMGGRRERQEAMGIDWMERDEISEAIPPAYTEYIGKQLMAVLL